MLRTLLAEHGQGRVPNERGPVRGLARLLRRNPTEAERTFWDALMRDRRFAGLGFKRQVPVGPHITDIVSFPLRLVDRAGAGRRGRGGAARSARGAARLARPSAAIAWSDMAMADVEADVATVLDGLAAACAVSPSAS